MTFAYVKPAPEGAPPPDQREEAMAMAKPLTPLSERPRHTWGSLLVSLQTSGGLCSKTSKCILKDGHDNPCWPGD